MKHERLKKDILDYLWTDSLFNPSAHVEILEMESASEDELVRKAKELGFELHKYE